MSDAGSNPLNQLAAISLFCGMLWFVLTSPVKVLVLQPRFLMIGLLVCLALTAMASETPLISLKQMILAVILLVNASVFLLLPRSEEQFARMIGIGLLIMLGFAYFGVVFKPLQAIHQYTAELGIDQVGNWRGHFTHKNVASAAMLISSCVGLYLKDKGFKLTGWLIVGLSAFFLVHTGGKTSTAMLPLILLIAYVFEKFSLLRVPIAVCGVVAINFFTVGAALIPSVYRFIESLGVDASFTNRDDIWQFAARAIMERPLLGYGLYGFWRTDKLINNDTVESWAPTAFNGHNAWIDTMINFGAIGFILMAVWILVLPLIYINQIFKGNAYSPVVRLYIRIWLYGLYASALESVFFESGSLLWFCIMVAIFGLRLQAVAVPLTETANMIGYNPSVNAQNNIRWGGNAKMETLG
ncbi:O-antigen ligase family protein [Pseudochrobactrum sp. MP213Fo]|uniref:O-antigen ligase family protein n=1 Tax=Pseudochrobactrum sp. MP213Fo TaxID=3022250 RepID=UPI003BA23D90